MGPARHTSSASYMERSFRDTHLPADFINGVPTSARFKAKAICSSANFDFFMAQLPIHHENCAENSNLDRYEITV